MRSLVNRLNPQGAHRFVLKVIVAPPKIDGGGAVKPNIEERLAKLEARTGVDDGRPYLDIRWQPRRG